MKVIGIETSCDETAVAIVDDQKNILSSYVLSQSEHEIFGGVVPEIAARAHMDHIDSLVKKSFADTGFTIHDMDAVAVTSGPGLIGGVLVGVMMAKGLALASDTPYIAINHLEGHALTPRLTEENLQFPYLLLLVSGGHTQILIVHGIGDFELLGTTIDDALGEAFDKTAKLMDLGYPGGPAVEKKAADCKDPMAALKRFNLPVSMRGRPGSDMSFSGLKTAVRRQVELLREQNDLNDKTIADLCAAFQQTCGLIVTSRLKNAVKHYLKHCPNDVQPSLVVSGGVAANQHIRQCLQNICAKNDMHFAAPPMKLCSDNAVMIAWAGIERLRLNLTDDIKTLPRPRWPLTELKDKAG